MFATNNKRDDISDATGGEQGQFHAKNHKKSYTCPNQRITPKNLNHATAMPLFESITNLTEGADLLRRRRYGVIEFAEGRLQRIVLRPLPKIISAPNVLLLGDWLHRHRSGDAIRLYYNQPLRFPNFLVLKYAESARETSYGTLAGALAVLDQIARLKHSDALLCDVMNHRITTRLFSRFGWEPHCPAWFHRHYIKRFYGVYPTMPKLFVSSPV